MRKLLFFTLGFAIASVLWAYILPETVQIYVAVIAAAFFVGLLLLKNRYSIITAIVMLGVFVGMLYCRGYSDKILSVAKLYDDETVYSYIEATDYSQNTNNAKMVDGKIALNGETYKVRLYFASSWQIEPGDVLEGEVEFRYTVDEKQQYLSYQKGEGIFLIAYACDEMMVTKASSLPGKYFPAYLRNNISQRIDQIFPERTAAFAKALLLGDDSSISFEQNIAFQESGIRHIIAVSGLHVSILFSAIYYLTGRKRILTLLAGLPILLIFAGVAGFTPSVIRACVMQALMIFSVAIGKEYDPPTSLSFAVIVMLLWNPMVITSISFQLSVGCMIGIFAFSRRISEYLMDEKRLGPAKGKSKKDKLKRWFIGSVSVSVSSMTVTMPLCAYYFGIVSVIGILTNLLTLWVVSTIFCGIIISCILSVFWIPLGKIAAVLISFPVSYVQFVSKTLAGVPFGVLYTDSPYTLVWIGSVYLLLLVFFLNGKKKPLLLTCTVIVMYALSVFMTWVEPYTDNFRMTVVDVGQGQAILLQSKNEAYLVDCGGSNSEQTASVTKNALAAQGVYSLDGVILTHFDQDHCNGLPYLLQIMDVEKLYLPNADSEGFIGQMIQQDVPLQWVTTTEVLLCGTGTITIYPAQIGTKGNESSMCILFSSEKCDILITGDRDISGEGLLLQQAELPDIEILVAGHHGAADATGLELLNTVKPEIAVISVGENNGYNHPNAQTLDRLERFGCIIRRTDLDGTIIIRG